MTEDSSSLSENEANKYKLVDFLSLRDRLRLFVNKAMFKH